VTGDPVWLEGDAPERLVEALGARGYRVIAPRVENDTLILAEVGSGDELPRGWSDEASPGHYRLVRMEDDPVRAAERFGFRVGAHSYKRYLHPPETRLFTARRERAGGLEVRPEPGPERPLALVGIRPCDLAAIRVQDRVLLNGPHVDDVYAARREGAFLVAVECTRPGATCFCSSMGTGPGVDGASAAGSEAGSGADLVLTELIDERRHGFVARAGTARGAEVLDTMKGRPANEGERDECAAAVEEAARSMERSLDLASARSALALGAELPLFAEVAERCLACANCTLVCPTCFCTTVVDTTDLTGRVAERSRHWDSCFGLEFSYLHGGSVRQSVSSRYRQWITHKLSSWFDQFGEAGCVGCGRCIAWCPVGIDITQEATTAIAQHGEAVADAQREPSRRGPPTRGARP
jgi:Fe-S-cluster-containing hydrogenase component 2